MPTEVFNNAFHRGDPAQYKLDFYPDETHRDARIIIRKLLDNRRFLINSNPVTKEELEELASTLPDVMYSDAIASGIVWVQSYVDGTTDTYNPGLGKPVVFDTVTGRAVTGIHPEWHPDEYKIIGIAYGVRTQGTGFDKIPIKLLSYADNGFRGPCRAIVYDDVLYQGVPGKIRLERRDSPGTWEDEDTEITTKNCQPLFKDEVITVDSNDTRNELAVIRIPNYIHWAETEEEIVKGSSGNIKMLRFNDFTQVAISKLGTIPINKEIRVCWGFQEGDVPAHWDVIAQECDE